MRFVLGVTAAACLVAAVACAPSRRERLYRIPSSAMEPTLHCAKPASGCVADEMDHVRVRVDSTPERGDIIVFRVPRRGVVACTGFAQENFTFVKRVVGLPGETWEQRRGYIYINGRRLREPYIKANRRDTETYPPHKIPAGHYLVLGDNRSSSCDSRRWGPVPSANVIGRVYLILRGDSEIEVD